MWTSGKIQQYPVCRPRRPQPRRLCGQRGLCQPVHCLATLAVGFSALSLLRIGMGVASPLLQQHSSVLPVMNQAVPSAAVPAAGQPKWRHTHGRSSPACVCARQVRRKCAHHHADSRSGAASAEYASHKGWPVEHVGHRRRRRTHQLNLSTVTHRHQRVQGATRLVGAYGARPSGGRRYQEQPVAFSTPHNCCSAIRAAVVLNTVCAVGTNATRSSNLPACVPQIGSARTHSRASETPHAPTPSASEAVSGGTDGSGVPAVGISQSWHQKYCRPPVRL